MEMYGSFEGFPRKKCLNLFGVVILVTIGGGFKKRNAYFHPPHFD